MNATDLAQAEPCLPKPCNPANSQHKRRERLKSSSAETYDNALRHFLDTFHGSIPCDAATVTRYAMSVRKTAAAATIRLRLHAIRSAHLRQGLPTPTDDPAVRELMRNLQLGILPGAKAGSAPKRAEPKHARPMTRTLLEKVCESVPLTSLGRRDRCLLQLAFGAALSRSALVRLNVRDVHFGPEVMTLTLREHDDPTRVRKVTVHVASQAAIATREWISHAALDLAPDDGPLLPRFSRGGDPTLERLSAPWINLVVKSRVKAIGVDPTNFSGSSPRRGRLMEIAKGVL
jgi:integrase